MKLLPQLSQSSVSSIVNIACELGYICSLFSETKKNVEEPYKFNVANQLLLNMEMQESIDRLNKEIKKVV